MRGDGAGSGTADGVLEAAHVPSVTPLRRGTLAIAVVAAIVAAVIGPLSVITGEGGQRLVTGLFLWCTLVMGGTSLVVHRLSPEDAATVTVVALLSCVGFAAIVLPQSAIVTVLCCVAAVTVGLQYLSERRLLLSLATASVAILLVVLARQGDRAPEATKRATPLWVLDFSEYAATIALILMIGFLLLQFRRRLQRTIVDLRQMLQRERTLRAENERRSEENAALEIARRAAEEQGRARGEFLAHVSHELRTPLNAIIGLAGLLEDEGRDARSTEHARIIRSSGDHLLTIVNEILDFSKIDSGAVTLGITPTSVSHTVGSVVELIRPEAVAKGLELTSRIGPELPDDVLTDSTRLRQILVNLTANAVRYSERGRVEIVVERAADGRIRFAVADDGPGIARERLARIFDPFVHAGPQGQANEGGTGLGLAISRNLAELMEGELTVESTVGRGSTFALTLPLPPAPAITGPDGAASWFDPGMAKRLPRRILVVEDNQTNQLVAIRMLEKLGYRADLAADGIEAIDAVARQRYDVVLMDMHLPRLGGKEASRAIRQQVAADHQPYIVAVTAAAFEGDRQACLAAGMDDFVAKPTTGPTLAAALERSAVAERAPAGD
ncbi:ATP-binding protein [Patulibacter defluvii]|uniref:ATP-binding protein n=1 Tax=Patulibacter defluvii TaxID=3095358 RepID=UPI002A75F8BB|nr:ATP-binding protein [Patulibacter sp. DM4]